MIYMHHLRKLPAWILLIFGVFFQSDTEDQMWDDSSMTAAYDKAVNKANAEIAKQIAMETNSKFKGNGT